jgi:hypothetical protein
LPVSECSRGSAVTGVTIAGDGSHHCGLDDFQLPAREQEGAKSVGVGAARFSSSWEEVELECCWLPRRFTTSQDIRFRQWRRGAIRMRCCGSLDPDCPMLAYRGPQPADLGGEARSTEVSKQSLGPGENPSLRKKASRSKSFQATSVRKVEICSAPKLLRNWRIKARATC